MEEYSEKEKKLVLRILELSADTAPITISFNYFKDNCIRHGIVIKSAPSKIIKDITKDKNGFICSLESDGLHMQTY
jgi:hypothetical protein